jgi:cyanate permease
MKSNYKWYVLGMALFTYGWIVGTARNCMPVLFHEIAGNLNLSMVSIGTVWGMDPLAGVFVGLISGLLVDRFGIRKTLTVICILAGLFSAVRGFSVSFLTMAGSMFLFGLMVAMLPVVVPKAAAVWFPSRQLGFINALINIAVSIGSMIATMLSATVLSPWLGGWRNVIFVLSVPAVLIGILWFFSGREPHTGSSRRAPYIQVTFKQSLTTVLKIRNVWMIGIIAMALWGSIMGVMGYLPMYLRNSGMSDTLADTAVTMVNLASLIGSIPMVLLANKLKAYKQLFMAAMIANALGTMLIPLVDHTWIWPVLGMTSFLRAGTAAMANVMLLETPGVGVTYVGTAMGLMSSLGMIGSFLSPPLGNAMTQFGPQWPFFLWAAPSILVLPLFWFIHRPRNQDDPSEFEEHEPKKVF